MSIVNKMNDGIEQASILAIIYQKFQIRLFSLYEKLTVQIMVL